MASYNELLALIDAYINRNGVQAITGQILNGVLKAMVDQLGRGYTLMGYAEPTGDPGTPDGPESWFASVPGTYTNYGEIQVAAGELALLSFAPSEGWTKNTIYEGFREVTADIDGNVGTPEVGVSYANGVLSFDFRNMKGNPGEDGDPAGFGAVTASVDDQVGTPSVSVSSSGPDTAKNFAFAFHNLKGETGVTSVVATVDNTSGNPQCSVSLQGGQLTLAFTGLKGAQGNTGSSVDYPFTIVNNLTTDDPTQALSAAMGVELDGKVSQLEAELNGQDVVTYENEGEIAHYTTLAKYYAARAAATWSQKKTEDFTFNKIFLPPTYMDAGTYTFYVFLCNDLTDGAQGSTYYFDENDLITSFSYTATGYRLNEGIVFTLDNPVTVPAGKQLCVVGYNPANTGNVGFLGNNNNAGVTTWTDGDMESNRVLYCLGAYWQNTVTTCPFSYGGAKYVASAPVFKLEVEGIIPAIEDDIEDLDSRLDTAENDIDALEGAVGDIPGIKAKTDEFAFQPGINLFNPSDPDVLIGYYIDGGAPQAYANYNSSGYIPVAAGKKYYTATDSTYGVRFVNYYNGEKTFLSKEGQNSITEFTTPANCAYIRVSFYAAYYDKAQISEIQTTFKAFAKELVFLKGTGDNNKSIATKEYVSGKVLPDFLTGKKWAPLGDSFTDGATNNTIPDGQYAGHRPVYPYFIGNRTGINVLSTFFASGRTLAWPATPGTFTNSICNPTADCYYQNIPADVDYITIYLGINDSHHAPDSDGGDGEDNTGEIPLGTISDATTATYYGAWNVVLDWLIKNRPFAHIGIIISNGCDTADYRAAQLAIAKKWGMPYIDLNGDERTPFMIRSQNTDIPSSVRWERTKKQAVDYDGSQTGTVNTHPSDAAHLFESYFIETFLRTI